MRATTCQVRRFFCNQLQPSLGGTSLTWQVASGHPCWTARHFEPATDFIGSVSTQRIPWARLLGGDMSVRKNFNITERMTFQIGLNAYNWFNHANYGMPFSNHGFSVFGLAVATQTPPKSPYGAFAAAATIRGSLRSLGSSSSNLNHFKQQKGGLRRPPFFLPASVENGSARRGGFAESQGPRTNAGSRCQSGVMTGRSARASALPGIYEDSQRLFERGPGHTVLGNYCGYIALWRYFEGWMGRRHV